MRAWPRLLTLCLGLIPVLMLGFIVVSVTAHSIDAITQVGSAPAIPALAEAADLHCAQGDVLDDDEDGLINDGCPSSGQAEITTQCAAGDIVDDDDDGRVNDGCPVNLVDYGPMSVARVANGFKALFGTDFSTIYTSGVGRYGLRPAIIGTISVTAIAMAIALPVALAMALLISEFPLGPFGRALRVVLAILAGIPPIVYALLAVVFVTPFMRPKFTADFTFAEPDPSKIGVNPSDWPPSDVPWSAGAFPWDPTGQYNSILLAGIMLALLVIPFIAPLFEDAFRNVPRDPKEASLALGATRWHTLRKITFPRALPGIVAGSALGVLRVIGDVMIVLFVVGFDANMPRPVFDVLERTAPLTSSGAALLGAYTSPRACTGNDCTVGYFSALLLLAAALVLIVFVTEVERRYRKRATA